MMRRVCPVCNTPGQTCGDDHMTLPPISSATVRGETMSDAKQELKEYEYYVGHVKLTAQMTAAQAEAAGAVEPGTAEAPETGKVANKESERLNSQMKDADADGVTGSDPDALNKARETRNRRAQ